MSMLPEEVTLLMQAVEAMLFVADEPMPASQFVLAWEEAFGTTITEADVEAAIAALNAAYEATGRVFRIYSWAGGYRLATIPSVHALLQAYKKEQKKLTRSLLETLAIIAYRQPITKAEIDHLRGVDTAHALHRLQELDLIQVVGRSDTIGRPLLYGTTQRFLDHFGLSSLQELPPLPSLETLTTDPLVRKEQIRALLDGLDSENSGTL